MGRWGVVAVWVLLGACGGSSGGQAGDSRDSGTPEAGDSGTPDSGMDGGTTGGGDSGVPEPGDGGEPGDAGITGCDALKPMLGTPVTFSTVVDGGACLATDGADGLGNLVVVRLEADGSGSPYSQMVIRSYDPSGNLLGKTRPLNQSGGPLPLASGWFAVEALGNPLRVGYGYTGFDLYRLSSSLDGGTDRIHPTDQFTGNAALAPAPLGGAGAVGGMPPPEIDGGVGYGTEIFRVTRFDASGLPVASADLGRFDTQQFSPRVAVNRAGDVLVIAGTQGWHLDPSGVLTAFPYPPGAPYAIFPLADGRFAVRGESSDGGWQATVSSTGEVGPAPDWLKARSDVWSFQLVHAGQGYAVAHGVFTGEPCERYLEVVQADGTSCGYVPLVGPATCNANSVAIGLDGTLTTLDDQTCTTRAWREAFGTP